VKVLNENQLEGEIKSQNGKTYKANSNCIWSIQAPKNYKILAKFKYFSIEREDVCGFDYVMLFTGKIDNLNSDGAKSEGVFCGTMNAPQNVGDDDWKDKALLIPSQDTNDGTLNRTMFENKWQDLGSRHAGLIFVSDSDTQGDGFVLEYKAVPIIKDVDIEHITNFYNYIHMKMLNFIRHDESQELSLIREEKVNKTIARLHRGVNKKCFSLSKNQVPLQIQQDAKLVDSITGYFNPLMKAVTASHTKCRTRHQHAWNRRLERLGFYISDV